MTQRKRDRKHPYLRDERLTQAPVQAPPAMPPAADRPIITLRLDPRTTVVVRSEAAVQRWRVQYPELTILT